jgi:hypothetical protein
MIGIFAYGLEQPRQLSIACAVIVAAFGPFCVLIHLAVSLLCILICMCINLHISIYICIYVYIYNVRIKCICINIYTKPYLSICAKYIKISFKISSFFLLDTVFFWEEREVPPVGTYACTYAHWKFLKHLLLTILMQLFLCIFI